MSEFKLIHPSEHILKQLITKTDAWLRETSLFNDYGNTGYDSAENWYNFTFDGAPDWSFQAEDIEPDNQNWVINVDIDAWVDDKNNVIDVSIVPSESRRN